MQDAERPHHERPHHERPHHERLGAPLSWFLGAAVFAIVCGWIVLVASWLTPALVTVAVVAGATGLAVARYGALRIAVDDEVRVGRAHLSARHVGAVTRLDREQYRHLMGPGANARAFLATRPWIDAGVRVDLDDPADPTPYWLLGSRDPDALAAAVSALRQTGPGSAPGGPQHKGA